MKDTTNNCPLTTNQLTTSDLENESLSGTAENQQEINTENIDKIRQIGSTLNEKIDFIKNNLANFILNTDPLDIDTNNLIITNQETESFSQNALRQQEVNIENIETLNQEISDRVDGDQEVLNASKVFTDDLFKGANIKATELTDTVDLTTDLTTYDLAEDLTNFDQIQVQITVDQDSNPQEYDLYFRVDEEDFEETTKIHLAMNNADFSICFVEISYVIGDYTKINAQLINSNEYPTRNIKFFGHRYEKI